MTNDKHPFGRRIRESLQIRGYDLIGGNFDYDAVSRTVLAKTGTLIPPKDLKSFTLGRRVPTLDVAVALCDGLGWDFRVLLQG